MQRIAIFGGTFDPVHSGHIQTSLTIQAHFQFDSYYFLPCKVPTLKAPASATKQQRVEMLQLALKDHNNLNLDLREITRDTPSYMVDTLESFKKENPHASITLVLGYDAFVSLPQWHKSDEIIHLANLLVINRASYAHLPVPDSINRLLKSHRTEIKETLLTSKAGLIYFFDAGHYEISSTDIREALKKNSPVKTLIPQEIYEYIKSQELYQ